MTEGRVNPHFEGAITASPTEPDASVVPAPIRPPRPPLVEFAAAVLVVGGLTNVLGVVGTLDPSTGPLDLLLLGLNVLTVVVGLLIRAGRAWILAVNVVAVVLFLELTALPSGVAIVFAALDTIVLVALFRHRGWFDGAWLRSVDGADA